MTSLLTKIALAHDQGTATSPTSRDQANAMTKSLYEILTILDDKARALMTFDAILVAGSTVMFEAFEGPWKLAPLVLILLSSAAAGLSLLVAQVSYPFLGKVQATPALPAQPGTAAQAARLDYAEEFQALDSAIKWRTLLYQLAWWLSIIAILLFVPIGIISLFLASA